MLFRLIFACLLLVLSINLQACGHPDSLRVAAWEDMGCDTTNRVDSLRIFDLVIPFRLADSLRGTLRTTPRIFVLVKENNELRYWAAVSGQFNERPKQLYFSPINDDSFRAKQIALKNVEAEFLWSLADAPEYLFNRWTFLLDETRRDFLARRDLVVKAYQQQFPSYEVKVSSDLRTAATQGRYLLKGVSLAPVSHHQLGLASDFAVVRQRKYQTNFQLYKQMGEVAKTQGLTWGGNFVGFIDPPHVQLFYNSAEMVKRFPDLRFEFEPFRFYYLKKVRKKIADGKEYEVLDTEQLLETLNNLRRDQPCSCEKAKRIAPPKEIQNQMKIAGYEPGKDILLVGDLTTQTVMLVHPSNTTLQFRAGRWR